MKEVIEISCLLFSVRESKSKKTGAPQYYLSLSHRGEPLTFFSSILPKGVDLTKNEDNGLLVPTGGPQDVVLSVGIRSYKGVPQINLVDVRAE